MPVTVASVALYWDFDTMGNFNWEPLKNLSSARMVAPLYWNKVKLCVIMIPYKAENGQIYCKEKLYKVETVELFLQGASKVLVRLSEPVQSLMLMSQKFYFMLISRFLSKDFMITEYIFWEIIFKARKFPSLPKPLLYLALI